MINNGFVWPVFAQLRPKAVLALPQQQSANRAPTDQRKIPVVAHANAGGEKQHCETGSICNQDSTNNGTQQVFNGAVPGKITYSQDGNTVTIKAAGGSVDSPNLALLFTEK